jgi:2-haloalkanoic acid dehalogenase type II
MGRALVKGIITFDCYGTLVDWEAGISGAFLAMARSRGATLEREAVLEAYARTEPELQRRGYAKYREILSRAAHAVANELGVPITPEEGRFLPESLADWPAFPDTNEALRRLVGAGYRLGILSNTDHDLFAETRKRLEVNFDLVIVAEQTRSYKPAHGHFLAARETIGAGPWLHAAQSHFHDVVPARALGIRSAWVNRKREPVPPGQEPDLHVGDLAGLADALV